MDIKRLNSTLLKSAGYDAKTQRLELEYSSGDRRVFKAVPSEVFRRLVSSPNPAAYYEDRIAEEYAWEAGSGRADGAARSRLDALFGGKAGSD